MMVSIGKSLGRSLIAGTGMLLLLAQNVAFAQSSSAASDSANNLVKIITGVVKSTQGEPVSDGLVTLLGPDSSVVKATFTNESGLYKLRTAAAPGVTLRVSHVGFVTTYRSINLSDSSSTFVVPLSLEARIINLKEVAVKENKALFEILGDRITVNVGENPAFAGRSLFDVLGTAPRITTDAITKTIALDGKPGLQLFVNGKQVQQPPIAYLQDLPANSVSKLEILTNPSAKYDAAGSGVILIQLRSIYREGLTGQIDLTAGIGRYVKGNSSVTLSLQTKKLQGSFLYAPTYGPTYYSWQSDQVLNRATSTGDFSRSNQYNYVDYFSHLVRTGWDWSIGKKTTLGTVLQLSRTKESQNPTSTLDYRLSRLSTLTTHVDALSQFKQEIFNLAGNLNVRRELTKNHSSISADLDITSFSNNARSSATFKQTLPVPLNAESFQIQYPNQVRIKTGKIDYQTPFFGKGSFDVGVKYSDIRMNNEPRRDQLSPSFSPLETLLTKAFAYQENTASVYGNAAYTWKRWSMTAGLRLEHTTYEGNSSTDQVINRNYTNLFPNLNVTYRNDKQHQFSVSANRRILRPSFELLNPAYNYYDPLTLYTGNPLLLPQLTTTLQSTITFPKRISLTLLYSEARNRITEVVYRIDSIQATTLNTNLNFDWERRWSATLSYPIQLTTHWRMQSVLTTHNTRYYLTFQDSHTQTGQTTAIIRLNNTFSGKIVSGSVNLVGRTPAVIGLFHYPALWSMDAGLQKTVNDRSSFKLAVTDVFHSMRIRNYGSDLNTNISFTHRYESQRFLLTYSYRLGNLKGKRVNERSFGSQSEQDRLEGTGARK